MPCKSAALMTRDARNYVLVSFDFGTWQLPQFWFCRVYLKIKYSQLASNILLFTSCQQIFHGIFTVILTLRITTMIMFYV